MSTVLFQSCLEYQEKETTTLRLKLLAPKQSDLGRALCFSAEPDECRSQDYQSTAENYDFNTGKSFLQYFSDVSEIPKTESDGVTSYVHPIVGKSSSPSKLSEKSLELCTESLGSESGTDVLTESSDIFSVFSSDLSGSGEPSRTRERNRKPRGSNWKRNLRDFPPPLTTMRGFKSLQVRSRREDGRLIMEAVESPSSHTFLQAERSHGRLRLSFATFDSDVTTREEYENGNEEDEGIIAPESDDETVEEERNRQDEEGGGEEEEGGGGESDVEAKRDMDGNNYNIDVEMGIEKFQRPNSRRCKESGGRGNRGLCNWEPFWVATS